MTNEEIKNQRAKYTMKFNNGRMNLIMAVVFSVVNIVFMLLNFNMFFLFAVEVSYFLIGLGMAWTGKIPEVEPIDVFGEEGYDFLPNGVLYVMIAIAAVILLYYVLCWFFSKKQRPGWLIAAAVGFIIDTGFSLTNLFDGDLSSLINVLFHIWVLYYLISGAVACYKLKELPPEEYVVEAVENEETAEETLPENEYALDPEDYKLPENGEENK